MKQNYLHNCLNEYALLWGHGTTEWGSEWASESRALVIRLRKETPQKENKHFGLIIFIKNIMYAYCLLSNHFLGQGTMAWVSMVNNNLAKIALK